MLHQGVRLALSEDAWLEREGPCPAKSLGSLKAASYVLSEYLELMDSVYLLVREGIEGGKEAFTWVSHRTQDSGCTAQASH